MSEVRFDLGSEFRPTLTKLDGFLGCKAPFDSQLEGIITLFTQNLGHGRQTFRIWLGLD